jgi:hypothetical protein
VSFPSAQRITNRLYLGPKEEDWKPFITPGPLTAASVALFGPDSLLAQLLNSSYSYSEVSNIICGSGAPLIHFSCDSTACGLHDGIPVQSLFLWDCGRHNDATWMAAMWLKLWDDYRMVEHMLSFILFEANRAIMTLGATGEDEAGKRVILSKPGYNTRKPSASFAAIVLLSILYGLQLCVLLFLAGYIIRYPTWTDNLDALALTRVVASMDPKELQSFSDIWHDQEAVNKKLREMDGLVGYSEVDEHSSASEGDSPRSNPPKLSLGGPGLLSSKMIKE